MGRPDNSLVCQHAMLVHQGEASEIHILPGRQEKTIEIQERGSATVYIKGAGVVRLEAALAGREASLMVIGRFEGKRDERQEVELRITQSAPKTSSRVDFRAALHGASYSSFDGLIRVEEGAAEATGFLSYKALLLSPSAKAKPIPRLEVLTKDVASLGHAASVGKIDKEQLFYLQSRGLPKEEAERLVVEGFLALPPLT